MGIVVDFVDVILGVFDVRTVLIAGTIFIPLERLRPLHRGQRLVREGWRTDLIFGIIRAVKSRTTIAASARMSGVWAASGSKKMRESIPSCVKTRTSVVRLCPQKSGLGGGRVQSGKPPATLSIFRTPRILGCHGSGRRQSQ